MNRTISETARTKLLEIGLSNNMWSDAVKAAVYTINHRPTSPLGIPVDFGMERSRIIQNFKS